MPHFVGVYKAGADQAARTPDAVLGLVRAMFFAGGEEPPFDPCPPAALRPPGFDGLAAPWRAANFVNPPWAEAREWLAKGIDEARRHGRASVFLLAARTYTRYFAELVFPNASHVVLFQNRVAFRGYTQGVSVPVAMYAFGMPQGELRLQAPPGWAATERPARMLLAGTSGMPPHFRDEVLPLLRRLFGPFDAELTDSRAPPAAWGRRNLVVVKARSQEHAESLAAFHAARPDATTLAIYMGTVLSTHYACRSIVPAASEVLFVAPAMRLSVEERRPSVIGSVAFVYGGRTRRAWRRRLEAELPARRVTFLSLGAPAGCGGTVGVAPRSARS